MKHRPKVLIAGASGLLGHFLSEDFLKHAYSVCTLTNSHTLGVAEIAEIKIDLLNFAEATRIVRDEKPEILVNCAGLTNVDACEADEKTATGLHVTLSATLAAAAASVKTKYVHISTDHLWKGDAPFVSETSPPQPINAYGRTKAAGEKAVQRECSDALIIRTNFYGPGLPWRRSFSDWIIQSLRSRIPIHLFTDVFFTPIALTHLAEIIRDLLEKDAQGIFHVAGSQRISKYEFGVSVAEILRLPRECIIPGSVVAANLPARRPWDMSLSVEKIEKFLGRKMPDIKTGIMTLNL